MRNTYFIYLFLVCHLATLSVYRLYSVEQYDGWDIRKDLEGNGRELREVLNIIFFKSA